MPLMLDREGLDAIVQAVAAECATMESEGLLTYDPLLDNLRVVGGDRDLRTVTFVADMRIPLRSPWTTVEGRESEVEARIKAAVERAMGLG